MKKRQPVGNRLHQLLSLKALGCYGDGGAIFTGDDDLARAMREIRVHGQESRYFHTRVGVGGRMDTLQCVVLLAKLDSFEEEVAVAPHANCRPSARSARASMRNTPSSLTGATRPPPGSTRRGIPTAVHNPCALH
jgi:UDP-2-acetamido-2-deoxy-ribo-hexuluronate aminotransferase